MTVSPKINEEGESLSTPEARRQTIRQIRSSSSTVLLTIEPDVLSLVLMPPTPGCSILSITIKPGTSAFASKRCSRFQPYDRQCIHHSMIPSNACNGTHFVITHVRQGHCIAWIDITGHILSRGCFERRVFVSSGYCSALYSFSSHGFYDSHGQFHRLYVVRASCFAEPYASLQNCDRSSRRTTAIKNPSNACSHLVEYFCHP